jgi:eukaryotic-like serine/threonine-protein kinase
MVLELAGLALVLVGGWGLWRSTRPVPVPAKALPARSAPKPAASALPGPLGDYELLQRVGEGGMATVYRGRSRRDGRSAAIKVIRDEFQRNEEFIARFRREIEISRKLKHPGIVDVYDAGEQGGMLYMAVEWLPGPTLEEMLQAGPLPLSVFARIAPALAQALQYAHDRELMHRDIKPGNIMLGKDGTPKILDFGLAVQEGQSRFTALGFSMGTPSHMAPEVLTSGVCSFASDQYALGVVFYQMLTGKCPFVAKNPVELGMLHLNKPVPSLQKQRVEIGARLEQVVLRMLEKEPSRRFPNLHQVAAALRS